jgi:hypothetical protein
MQIVARPRCDYPLDLSPGLYLASVTLPSGVEHRMAVELEPGQALKVVLGPDLLEDGPDREGFALDSAVVQADLPGSAIGVELQPKQPTTRSRCCWVRVVSGENGEPLDELKRSLRPVDVSERELASGIELEYSASPADCVVFAQIATDDGAVRNVALPAAAGSEIPRCRVHILLSDRRALVTALPAARTSTTLLASYLVTGNLRSAANLAAEAEQMLTDQRNDPVGAALGGYALLRLGRTRELPDEPPLLRRAYSRVRRGHSLEAAHWLGELAERYEWFPDGAIVAAERARRSGNDNEADSLYALALRRGLPMFSDGLSLLVSELRAGSVGVLVRRHAKRLLATASFADYSQLAVALPGIDPTRADDEEVPLSALSATAGWQELEYRS